MSIAAYSNCVYEYFHPKNPVTEQREYHLIPAFAEKAVGWAAYPFHLYECGGVIREDNPKFGRYVKMVQEIGQKLVTKCPRQDLKFEFKVVNSREDTAWCLPGGKIGISRGLIKHLEVETTDYGHGDIKLEDKVGAVLRHEMIHAAACHFQREIGLSMIIPTIISIASFAITLWVEYYYFGLTELALKISFAATVGLLSFVVSCIEMSYSRSYELEADRYGIELMHNCKMDPKGALFIMSYFNTYNDDRVGFRWFDKVVHYLSSHPTHEERLETNKRTIEALPKG